MSRRRKYTEPEPMTDEVKALLAENRKRKRTEEDERRATVSTNGSSAVAWRRNQLQRYVARVLELDGLERLEFFEAHPIASIFR